MGTRHGHEHEPSAGVQHETRDVHVRPLAWLGVGLAMLIVVAFVMMKGVFELLDRQQARSDTPPLPMVTQRPQQPPEPRLQTTPVPNRKLVIEQETKLLTTYGWVDQKAGTVHIPVERAMQLLAERGLPSRGASSQLSAVSGKQAATGTKSER